MHFGFLAGFLTASLLLSAPSAAEEVRPSHVLREVLRVHATVESIRLRLGISGALKPAFDVSGATPYEVYFQALALLQKSNWLAREFDGEITPPPALTAPVHKIRPEHVLAVIEATYANLRPFQARIGIPPSPYPEGVSINTTPTDVYRAILDAGQMLNLLLRIRIQPPDVYREVTLASDYVGALLRMLDVNADTLHKTATQPEHIPYDVFRNLTTSYATIKALAETSGTHTLELSLKPRRLDRLYPGDNYDLASLVLAEVAFLYALADGDRQIPPLPHDPGDISDADVYDQVNGLNHRLSLLLDYARRRPDWLSSTENR